MCKDNLNVAFFQQDIRWEAPEANYVLIEQALAASFATAPPPDLIVVPETFATGFSDHMALMAEPPQGPTYRFALHMAQRYDALFAGSWTVKDGGKVFNRLHCVLPDGSCQCYDKAHTFRMSSEASQLARGTQPTLVEWRGWRIRLAVCYDLRFPLWLRNHHRGPAVSTTAPHPDLLQPQLDYDLLLVCANWPASRCAAWDTLLKARAIENQCYAVGVNRVGTDGTGIPYAGGSAAIDFKGFALAQAAPQQQQVVTACLAKAPLTHFRQHWPFWIDADDTPAFLNQHTDNH